MVLYKGYCRPLGKKVDFTVKDVISMKTKRGIKWRVKGIYEKYNISTFCSQVVAQELLNKLPLAMDAEIAYTPPATTYESEELKPSFSNATKKADEIEAEDETIEVQEQIQENTNAQELDLHSEKLPAKYYKKNGSLDMRYSICREYAAKGAESQNAVELEAPYTPVKPERPSDDYGGGGKNRRKPRRPLGAEMRRKAWLEKCDICSESPIYEKDVNIEDYDDPIQVCQSCFDDIFTDKAAESFEADGTNEPITITHVIVVNEGNSGNSIRKKIRNAFDKVGYQISPVPKKMKGLTYIGSNSNPVETFIYNEHINKFRNALEEQGLSPLFAEVFNDYGEFSDEQIKLWNSGEVDWPAPNSEDLEYLDQYHDAESFEAAYTPEQRLDDYTPEQLTTSSAVTGDFFEDSLKYSYGGTQAAEEIPQEETEIVYAEGFPALQNAEAGMVVENIENYYMKKEDKFMTILVDEATLFRMAPELPNFVELITSDYAGYTKIKFNYVENPDMEQQILSYAITLQDNSEQQEEPEYRAGDIRNRLFNVEFEDWAEQEMKTHGNDVSFKDWADEESESHGDDEFMDWAEHEEESHDERYEAEGGRNVSDFEMGNTDRYEIGDEIIDLSSALKKAGDWDWKNVKKIGKGIKQGKYERIKKHMADIDFKTRRVLWDKHHNDFYDLFTDEQMKGLAGRWVTDKYKAEISDEKLELMERKFHKKIDSYQEGINYTACKYCGLECKVEALEDTQGNILYHFYSCKCGHNDIQDSSYGAESFEAKQERKPRKMCVNCDKQSLTPAGSRLGKNVCSTCQRRFGLKSKKAESFDAQDEPRKKCINCNKQKLTPSATSKGYTICGTCTRRYNLGGRKYAESVDDKQELQLEDIIKYLENSHRTIRKYNAPYKYSSQGIAEHFQVGNSNISKKLRQLKDEGIVSEVYRRIEDSPTEYGLSRPVLIYYLSEKKIKAAEDNGDEEYKFVSRIPKSMGMGAKTEIQRKNLEYVFEKANRPLYPREVVELYNRERGTAKQSNFKKGGLSTRKISLLIKSEPKKYYVSRSGLIHHVGETSIKDYIRNLPAKYYAEENKRNRIPREDILKYLQNSHEYIRRYTAPWKYTSYGIAEEFGIAPSNMRSVLRQMELKDLVKTVSKGVEDSPVPSNKKLKIYYLANERLLNQ